MSTPTPAFTAALRAALRRSLRIALAQGNPNATLSVTEVQGLGQSLQEALDLPPNPWGQTTAIHRIGSHTLTEYISEEAPDAGTTYFQAEGTSYPTLDQALLGALCTKYGHSDFHEFACRALEMP